MSTEEIIDRMIATVDWQKIKTFHKKLGLVWDFDNFEETAVRLPNIPELQVELAMGLRKFYAEDLTQLRHGNWFIYTDAGEVKIIFQLAIFQINQDKDLLENALKRAIEREDYESAAKIKDNMQNLQKRHNKSGTKY